MPWCVRWPNISSRGIRKCGCRPCSKRAWHAWSGRPVPASCRCGQRARHRRRRGSRSAWASATIPGPDHSQPLALELDGNGRSPDAWDRQVIETAAQLAALALAADRGRTRLAARATTGAAPLIGSSAVMRALRERIERVAVADFTVLIDGESGTGKELVARQIHELSPRRLGAVRRGELRCAGRDAARGRAVRHRGAHRYRRPRPARQVRARRRRHPVPRRGRRPVAGRPGQAAACHPGAGRRARRRARHPAAQRAHRRRHQHVTGGAGPARAVPGRPLLPVERSRPAGAAAAPPSRGHRGAGAVLPGLPRRSRAHGAYRRPRPTPWPPTTGRATCGSCSGRSRGRWRWPTRA